MSGRLPDVDGFIYIHYAAPPYSAHAVRDRHILSSASTQQTLLLTLTTSRNLSDRECRIAQSCFCYMTIEYVTTDDVLPPKAARRDEIANLK